MSEITFTKKDVRDYLMANPEAEHQIADATGCVVANFLHDYTGDLCAVTSAYFRPLDVFDNEEMPAWGSRVVKAFDGMGFPGDRFASWEVLAALDPILKDES